MEPIPPMVCFPKRRVLPSTYQEDYIHRPRPNTPKTHFPKTPMYCGFEPHKDHGNRQNQFQPTPPAPRGWQYSEVPLGQAKPGTQIDHTIVYKPVMKPPPQPWACRGPTTTELPEKFANFNPTGPVWFRNDLIDAAYKEALQNAYARGLCGPRPWDRCLPVQMAARPRAGSGIRWEENKPNPRVPNVYTTRRSIYTEVDDPNDIITQKVTRLAREGRLARSFERPIPHYTGFVPRLPVASCTEKREEPPHMISDQHKAHVKFPNDLYHIPKYGSRLAPFSKMVTLVPPHNPFNIIEDKVYGALRL